MTTIVLPPVPRQAKPGDFVWDNWFNDVLRLLTNNGTGAAITNPMVQLGDMLYGGAGGVPIRLVGNTSGTIKYLAQTGDGSASGIPRWQAIPISGIESYFFYNIASDIGGYLQAQHLASVGGLVNIATTSVTDTQILATFATNANDPGITYFPPGVVTIYISGEITSGTKTTQLYAEMYQRNLAGTETLRATSAYSVALNGTLTADIVQALVPTGFAMLSTDRIVVKIRAHISGGGSAPNVTIGIEDATAARIDLPSNIVDLTSVVPYTGASLDLNMGTHKVLAANVKATTAGGYLSSDGSAGYTGTVTTALLVGKTITFKDGLVTGFA